MVPDATRWFGPRNLWLTLSAVAIGYLAVRLYLLLSSSDPLLGVDARAYWGYSRTPARADPVGTCEEIAACWTSGCYPRSVAPISYL